MAEEETTQQERTEEPSMKRREDFREKGQVAQSKEVQTAALLTASLILWFFYGSTFWQSLSEIIVGTWQMTGEYELSVPSVIYLAGFILQKLAVLLLPFFILVVVIGFFSSFLQIGWVFSTKPLEPDLTRLDPVKGSQKFFSKRSLVEVVKSLAKVGLIGAVAYYTVKNEFNEALYLVAMDISETIRYLARVGFLVMSRACGILIILGLLDFLFVRWEMEQKMKMTKHEQKEEFKDTEGDPQIKSRIRSIQYQIARKRMMAEVPKADVVVTNPTHLSVALLYKRGEMEAPQVVAKGAGHIAMRIREVAKEHGVPLVENPPVARALHKIDIGAMIPEELFKAVAEILAYVYNLKRKN